MTATAAPPAYRTKTQADLDRSLVLLQAAYARAGKPVEIALHRDGRLWRLTADGYTITSGVDSTAALWERLLDMRRAVEVLDQS